MFKLFPCLPQKHIHLYTIKNDLWAYIFSFLSLSDLSICQTIPQFNPILSNKKFKRSYMYAKYGLKLDPWDTIEPLKIEKILISDYDTFTKFNEIWHTKFDPNTWLDLRFKVLESWCPWVSENKNLTYWYNVRVDKFQNVDAKFAAFL